MSAAAAARAVSREMPRCEWSRDQMVVAGWRSILAVLHTEPDQVRLARVCKAAYEAVHDRKFVHLTGSACNQYALLTGLTKRMAEDLRRRTGYTIPWEPGVPWKRCPSYRSEEASGVTGQVYLGSGSFGITLFGHDLVRDRAVAIKVTPLSESREIEVTRQIGHLTHVMRPLDSCQADDRYFQVMDVGGMGNLNQLVSRLERCDDRQIKEGIIFHVVSGVMKALAALHRHGYFHLDLKPDNVVIDVDGRVRLIDFGCSKHSESGMLDPTQGDARHHAPDRFVGDAPFSGEKSDAFSLGLILLILLHPEYQAELHRVSTMTLLAAKRSDHPELIDYVQRRLDRALEDDGEGVANLARALLDVESSTRLSPAAALSHPWMLKMERSVDKDHVRLHLLDLAAVPPASPLELPTPWRALHVNRTTLTVTLRSQLLRGTQPLLAVVGPPGIGKTHLVQDIVHSEQIQRRFDTIAWFPNCDDFKKLAQWHVLLAKELGLSQEASYEEIRGPLMGYLAARSTLLVFDGAPSFEELRPYLPVCREVQVLVTSSHRDWPHAVEVGRLSPVEATTLVARVAGEGVGLTAPELVDTTDRVPQQLIWAAAATRHRGVVAEDEPISIYARQIPPIRDHFERVYAYARDKQWMLAMALIGDQATPKEFCLASGVLDRLVEDLVLRETDGAMMKMHPALRDLCLEGGDERAKVEALQLLAPLFPALPERLDGEFYSPEVLAVGQSWLHQWEAVSSPELDTEATVTTRAWVRLCAACQGTSAAQHDAVVLPMIHHLSSIAGHHENRKQWRSALFYFQAQLSLCKLIVETAEPELSSGHHRAGVAYFEIGDLIHAQQHLEAALELIEPTHELSDQLHRLAGQCSYRRGLPWPGFRHMKQIKQATEEDIRLHRRCLFGTETEEYIQQGLIMGPWEDRETTRLGKEALARYYHKQGEFAKALSRLERMEEVPGAEPWNSIRADCYNHAAIQHLIAAEWDQAEGRARQSLEAIADGEMAQLLLGIALCEQQGEVAFVEGSPVETLLLKGRSAYSSRQSTNKLERRFGPAIQGRALLHLGSFHYATGHMAKAKESYSSGFRIVDEAHRVVNSWSFLEVHKAPLPLLCERWTIKHRHRFALALQATGSLGPALKAMKIVVDSYESKGEVLAPLWEQYAHLLACCDQHDKADEYWLRASVDRPEGLEAQAAQFERIGDGVLCETFKEQCYRNAVAIAQQLGDPQREADVLQKLLHVLQPNAWDGEAILARLVQLLEQAHGERAALSVGQVLLLANDRLERRVDRAQRALALIGQATDEQSAEMAEAHHGLGLAFAAADRMAEALGCFATCLRICGSLRKVPPNLLVRWMHDVDFYAERLGAREFGERYWKGASSLLPQDDVVDELQRRAERLEGELQPPSSPASKGPGLHQLEALRGTLEQIDALAPGRDARAASVRWVLLGSRYLERDRPDDLLRCGHRALRNVRRGVDPELLVQTLLEVGDLYLLQRNAPDALQCYSEAHTVQDTASIRVRVGIATLSNGLTPIPDIYADVFSHCNPDPRAEMSTLPWRVRAEGCFRLGQSGFRRLRNHQFRECEAHYVEHLGEEHPATIEMVRLLGQTRFEIGELGEASRLLRLVFHQKASTMPPGDDQLVDLAKTIGISSSGDVGARFLEYAHDRGAPLHGANSAWIADILECRMDREKAEAVTLGAQAVAIRRGSQDPLALYGSLKKLLLAHAQRGDASAADAIFPETSHLLGQLLPNRPFARALEWRELVGSPDGPADDQWKLRHCARCVQKTLQILRESRELSRYDHLFLLHQVWLHALCGEYELARDLLDAFPIREETCITSFIRDLRRAYTAYTPLIRSLEALCADQRGLEKAESLVLLAAIKLHLKCPTRDWDLERAYEILMEEVGADHPLSRDCQSRMAEQSGELFDDDVRFSLPLSDDDGVYWQIADPRKFLDDIPPMLEMPSYAPEESERWLFYRLHRAAYETEHALQGRLDPSQLHDPEERTRKALRLAIKQGRSEDFSWAAKVFLERGETVQAAEFFFHEAMVCERAQEGAVRPLLYCLTLHQRHLGIDHSLTRGTLAILRRWRLLRWMTQTNHRLARGQACYLSGHLDAAMKWLSVPPSHGRGEGLVWSGQILVERGRVEEGIARIRRGMSLFEQQLGAESEELTHCRALIANAQKADPRSGGLDALYGLLECRLRMKMSSWTEPPPIPPPLPLPPLPPPAPASRVRGFAPGCWSPPYAASFPTSPANSPPPTD